MVCQGMGWQRGVLPDIPHSSRQLFHQGECIGRLTLVYLIVVVVVVVVVVMVEEVLDIDSLFASSPLVNSVGNSMNDFVFSRRMSG
jgi:hypothetical protein